MSQTALSPDFQQVWQQDKDHHVHPWTHFPTFKQTGSLILNRAEGAYVYDAQGNRYLDGIGGLWCVNVGYGRKEIAQAMAEQAENMVYYSSFGPHTSVPAAQLAHKLATLAPDGLNHIQFDTGGSMANDTAIRMVHYYFNRLGKKSKKKIITRHDGYHGSTYLAMSLTGVAFDHQGFDIIDDGLIHRIASPNCYRRPDGMSLEAFCDQLVGEFEHKIEQLGAENVAAFIAEPIMGAGGVIVAPPGYHARMLAVCRQYEVLYIADEVVTAFGRLGHFFASQSVFDMVPDIITSAKGLSSAYAPLSATILSDRFYDVISTPESEGTVLTHGFTYSGHPVCCAAGLKNIEILEREDICGHVRAIGPYFQQQLDRLSELDLVGDVRGSHFMLCVENVANQQTKALLSPDLKVGDRIAAAAQKRGVLVRPIGHLNVLSPPLILDRAQIDTLVSVLRESIIEVMGDLMREGVWHGSIPQNGASSAAKDDTTADFDMSKVYKDFRSLCTAWIALARAKGESVALPKEIYDHCARASETVGLLYLGEQCAKMVGITRMKVRPMPSQPTLTEFLASMKQEGRRLMVVRVARFVDICVVNGEIKTPHPKAIPTARVSTAWVE